MNSRSEWLRFQFRHFIDRPINGVDIAKVREEFRVGLGITFLGKLISTLKHRIKFLRIGNPKRDQYSSMAQVRSNGCLLIFIGFCLGWGFAQLSRPADTTTTATPAPAASMALQSQVQSAPAPVAATDPSPAPVSPEQQGANTSVDLEREAARASALPDAATTGELRTTLSSADETATPPPETTAASLPPPELSDARIRRLMIQDSIANFYGLCPCTWPATAHLRARLPLPRV
jgi:hypothetical protein